MSQNTSHAVMSQRAEPHDSLDFFPTRAWATRALCEWLKDQMEPLDTLSVWEPACGEGHMARPLAEYFRYVEATDIHPYGFGGLADFLMNWGDPHFDWIITNPPFRLGEQFAKQAVASAHHGAALIVRTAFLESAGRYAGLFRKTPPSDILQFTERVPMHRGRVEEHGSTATAYCWLVWLKGSPPGTRFHWLAPCRKKLERPGDYDASPAPRHAMEGSAA
jgi:hypothetical protein